MKQTLESFEAMNLEYENLYNEDDERREYNSIWYSYCLLYTSVIYCLSDSFFVR